jgi:hypothetical protein
MKGVGQMTSRNWIARALICVAVAGLISSVAAEADETCYVCYESECRTDLSGPGRTVCIDHGGPGGVGCGTNGGEWCGANPN